MFQNVVVGLGGEIFLDFISKLFVVQSFGIDIVNNCVDLVYM